MMSHHDVQEERIGWPKRLTDAAKAGPALVLSGGGALGIRRYRNADGRFQAGIIHSPLHTHS